MAELKENSKFVGAKAVAKSGAKVVTSWKDQANVYNIAAGDYYYCTGYYFDSGWMLYVQTTNGMYLEVDLNNPAWLFSEDEFISVGNFTDNQAQRLINTIIKNNETIIRNNLLCARFASKLTAQQRSQVRSLQLRLQERNNALQAEGLTKDVQTSAPAGYAELSAYLDKLMSGEAIGIAASTVALIVVSAVVAIGLGTAAYYAYKELADESEADVKFSKELTATLVSKLTPEEYQQLLDETKGIVTKAKIKQLIKSNVKWITIAAIAALGYLGYKKFFA